MDEPPPGAGQGVGPGLGHGARVPARADPERLLGLGEAAELLGLPLLELQRALRHGRLAALPGRRHGRRLRLVRVAELARLDPAVLDRELPPPVPGTELAGEPDGPAFEPLRLPREGARAAARERRPVEPTAYLWTQLDQLREEVRSAKAANRHLIDELGRSGREVHRLLDKVQRDERDRHALEQRLAAERAGVDRALGSLRRTRRLAAAALGVVLLGGGSGLVWYGGQGSMGDAVLAAPPAGDVARGASRGLVDRGPVDRGPVDRGPVDRGDDGVPRPTVALPPELPPLDEDSAALAPDAIAPAPAESEVPELDAAPLAPPRAGELERPVPREAPWRADEGAAPVEGNVDGDPAGEPPLGREPPGAQPGDEPCAWAADTARGSTWRAVLGPCYGRWNPELEAVVGAHRHDGVAACRHHDFLQRVLRGSKERARELARFARSEGLVPPLVKLRVDRAGRDFLRARTGVDWVDSGFEAGSGADHALTALPGDDAWRIASWVRWLDAGGREVRRRFTMELVLDEGPDGDRLTHFVWSGDGEQDE